MGWVTAIGASTVATGVALAFPQLTSSVAVQLGSIDKVLTEPVRPSLVPPSSVPDEEQAPLSALDRVKGLFSERPPHSADGSFPGLSVLACAGLLLADISTYSSLNETFIGHARRLISTAHAR